MRRPAVLAAVLAMTVGVAAAQWNIIARADGRRAERIDVLSDGGAHCTLHREGKLLGEVSIQPAMRLGMGSVDVDITDSKADILVACSLNGVAKSALSRWERDVTIYDGPPCLAGAPSSCRSAWNGVSWRYRSVVRVLFHPLAGTPQHRDATMVFYSVGGTLRAAADLELMRAYGAAGSTPREFTSDQRTVMDVLALDIVRANQASMCSLDGKEDARFEIVADGTTYLYRFRDICPSMEARALIDAMLCAADPADAACRR